MPAADFRGSPQVYVAQLEVTTEALESRRGAHDLTHDDLGEWFTFAFTLPGGALAAVVREVHNAPSPGYILTAIGYADPSDILTEFLTASGMTAEHVTHQTASPPPT
ncbi:hypothetical protein EEJ42_17930 [Streptomyces botrytidirepellens]|uniref:Uncharacterized protein n=1 Tax=Streptomyces botrytidirepellens TaxID=2486417 RepID=A0A3M8W3V9_9ACTN|nr:hypothetical protein EEJ42_17930 [Streptomyces botrytidirepellens]